MNTQANATLHLPLLSKGMTALLLGGIAIASLAISAQGFDGVFVPATPPDAAAAPAGGATGAYKCAECGVIESTRKIQAADARTGVNASGRVAAGNRDGIEGTPSGSYAITIRLRDGSLRTITDANAAKWRPGERVTLISAAE